MNSFNKNDYEKLSTRILDEAKKQGAESAEVTISIEQGFSVSSRLGQVETVEHHHDKGVGITVYLDQHTGCASSSDLTDDGLKRIIEKACNIAKYTNLDPYSGLADRDQLAFNYPQLDLDYPWEISTEEALEVAIECENIARSNPKITNSEGVSVHSHRSLQVYANSQDFLGSYTSTQHSMNCVLIAQEDGRMHRDYEYTLARDAQDLMHIEKLAQQAVHRTVHRLGARRLKTRSSPVIFSPQLARSLLGCFVNAINGSNIYRKSSFLVDHLQKTIFPSYINLTQQPHIPKALGSAPFDNEGVRTRQLDFVQEGVLQNYLLSSYSGRKLGMKSTGNAGGVYNLQISTTDFTLAQLLKEMGTGLLVTELIGQGVNIVTGDYSRGAFGFWVENGEIQFPVEEITIAGNLQEIFMNIIAVANDVDTRGRIHTGSILVDKMMIAGE